MKEIRKATKKRMEAEVSKPPIPHIEMVPEVGEFPRHPFPCFYFSLSSDDIDWLSFPLLFDLPLPKNVPIAKIKSTW